MRQGWERTLPGKIVLTIARDGVELLQVVEVEPMQHAQVGYLHGAHDGVPPAPTAAPTRWTIVADDEGRLPLQWPAPGSPQWIAIPVWSPSERDVDLLLRFYLGLRLWVDNTQAYETATVPFHYRGTEDFASLVPVTVHLTAGLHWLVADVSRARARWGFGVIATQASGVRFTTAP